MCKIASEPDKLLCMIRYNLLPLPLSLVSRQILGFLVISLDTDLLHPRIHLDPPALEIRVEVRFVAWELVTLEAEVRALLLGALHYIATRIPASPVPASSTISPGKMFQEFLELGIISEHALKR